MGTGYVDGLPIEPRGRLLRCMGPLLADFVAKVILKRSRIVIHRGDAGILRDRTMMGRVNRDQGQLFYCFNLEETVPEDHQGPADCGSPGSFVGPCRAGLPLFSRGPKPEAVAPTLSC
jgi:hypothetical protein